jgi:hypothetical protein
MESFQTSATVEAEGLVHVAGAPFDPGTRVEVTIRPIEDGEQPSTVDDVERTARLFAALDKARNTETVGPLRRDELYDRRIIS